MPPYETLEGFRARTHAFIYDSLDASRPLETRPGLERKVDPAGGLRPYYGNTVVFRLPELVKEALAGMQELLYQECAPILSERLKENALHITLHDLKSGPPSHQLELAVLDIQPEASRLVRDIRKEEGTIRLVSTALFKMVDTSMVLGFEPEDEESCRRLMSYYERFQPVAPLLHGLTPHVTLAYFRPGAHDAHWVEKLQRASWWAGERPPIRLELTGRDLEYQVFANMNAYWPG